MKKTIGYGYKLASESLEAVIDSYMYPRYGDDSHFDLTKKETVQDIKKARARGDIPKSAKVQIFKVTAEVVDHAKKTREKITVT